RSPPRREGGIRIEEPASIVPPTRHSLLIEKGKSSLPQSKRAEVEQEGGATGGGFKRPRRILRLEPETSEDEVARQSPPEEPLSKKPKTVQPGMSLFVFSVVISLVFIEF
ncbi:hypothetical protein L2V44_14275, partial [Staphylococcus aureus]|nr:hypothetical protein [Staphylococcus aureus]